MDQFTGMILRGVALPTAAVGVVITIGTWIAMGSAAAIGALLATALVIAFFMVGQVVLATVLRKNPIMAMPVALVVYVTKIGVLFGLLLLFADATWFDSKVFALTVLACTLVWTALEVVVINRSKVLVVEPDAVPPAVRELSELSDDQS